MKTIDAPKGLESPVWAYFGFKSENGKDISDKGTTVCKICKIELVYKTGSTSNLRRHLDRKHPHVKLDTPQSNKAVACKRTSENEIKGSEPKKQMRQSTLDEVQIRENTPQISAQKASKFTDAIAKFIVKDLRPISVVSNEGFRNLLKVLQPGYVVPSASHFSQQVIPNLYDATKSNVLKYIEEASALATTTDGWTSRSTDSYITITVHCLNESFEMTSFVLQTRELSVSHTAENLSEVLNCAIKEWGLIKDGLKPTITTDNAANIVNAVFKSGLVHVRCMAHTLNLATQKGMKVEGLSEILRKVRRIVGFFHRSSTAAALLKSNQIGLNVPVPKHKLIQDVETRWNSSFDMLKRILEQKHVISATLMMKDIKLKDKDGVNNLTEEDYAAIEDIVQVLSPFKTATEALSGERYPTVSLIFSMKMTLLTHLKPALSDSDMVKRMKEVMHADLSTRYNGQETEQFLLEASILDPRFKLVPHATEEQKAKAYGSFRDQMLSILQTKTEGEEHTTSMCTESGVEVVELPVQDPVNHEADADDNNNTQKLSGRGVGKEQAPEKKSALTELFGDIFSQGCVSVSVSDKVSTELNGYRGEPNIRLDENPLHWWNFNKEKYPLLAHIAKKYLVTQATSVASERVFSTAGDIVCAQRSCLKSETVDMLLFLKKNLVI